MTTKNNVPLYVIATEKQIGSHAVTFYLKDDTTRETFSTNVETAIRFTLDEAENFVLTHGNGTKLRIMKVGVNTK